MLFSPNGTFIKQVNMPELCSSHEEADTRLLPHAAHASHAGFNTVVIQSPDADVAILALFFSFEINSQLFFRTGTKNHARFINVNMLAAKHGKALCQALPGPHALTGCDSTSAFVGKGKKQALRILKEPANSGAHLALASLGHSFDVPADVAKGVEKFVCQLYGSVDETFVNEMRYRMFCLRAAQSSQLPPCQDALLQHILRANYLAAIWRHLLVPRPNVPSPDGCGWKLEDGALRFHWMNQEPAPTELLELVSCGCKTGCLSR